MEKVKQLIELRVQNAEKRKIMKPIWLNNYITHFEEENGEILVMVEQKENAPYSITSMNSIEGTQLRKNAVQKDIQLLEESDIWVKVTTKENSYEF